MVSQDVSNILHACALVGYSQDIRMTDVLIAQMTLQARAMLPQNLSTSVWALSQILPLQSKRRNSAMVTASGEAGFVAPGLLQLGGPIRTLLDTLCEAVTRHGTMQDARPKEWCVLMTSLAGLRYSNAQVMDLGAAALELAAVQAGMLPDPAGSDATSSSSKANIPFPVNPSRQSVNQFPVSARDLSSTIYACGVCHHSPPALPQLVQALASLSAGQAQGKVAPQDLSNALWGLSALGELHTQRETVAELMAAVNWWPVEKDGNSSSSSGMHRSSGSSSSSSSGGGVWGIDLMQVADELDEDDEADGSVKPEKDESVQPGGALHGPNMSRHNRALLQVLTVQELLQSAKASSTPASAAAEKRSMLSHRAATKPGSTTTSFVGLRPDLLTAARRAAEQQLTSHTSSRIERDVLKFMRSLIGHPLRAAAQTSTADGAKVLRVTAVQYSATVRASLGVATDLLVSLSDGRRVAVEVDGESHYLNSDLSKPDGSTCLRNSVLEGELGVGNVRVVHVREWRALKDADAKGQYLSRLLTAEL